MDQFRPTAEVERNPIRQDQVTTSLKSNYRRVNIIINRLEIAANANPSISTNNKNHAEPSLLLPVQEEEQTGTQTQFEDKEGKKSASPSSYPREQQQSHSRDSTVIPKLTTNGRKFSFENLAKSFQHLWEQSNGEYQRRQSISQCQNDPPPFQNSEANPFSLRSFSFGGYRSRRRTSGERRESVVTRGERYDLYPKDFFWKLEGKMPKSNAKMKTTVDAVGKVTGEWGIWQLRAILLIFLCKIPSSWFMACIIFTAPAPRHGEFFCKPPHHLGVQNQTLWVKVSHPQKEEADDQEFSIDFCNVYRDAQEHAHYYYKYENPADEPLAWEEPSSNKADIIPCTHFQHRADFHSVITQFDLVCSRDILVSVTQFFHLFGVLLGGILANHLLKYFSPRYVMLFGMITQILCGNLTGHVASYELHVFFRCLSAICCAQMYTAGGVIMADITGGIYKTCVTALFEQFWSIGVILLPGLASFFKSWTHLYMAISWPTLLLIYLWQWIPDSPRWMLNRGRIMEAKRILIKCAEFNGTRHHLPDTIDQELEQQAQTALDSPLPPGWQDLWHGRRTIINLVCVHLCWSIYIVVYYGMLLNIRSFSREHLEVNTIVAGVCEITGTFIGLALILMTTRKWLWTGIFNMVAGCLAYTGWLVPINMDVNGRVALLMVTAMISKIAISSTLAILTTCTVELVSAEKRKMCSFSTICWARLCLLGAPFIGATVVFGTLVPQTAFASLAIVGGILTTLITSPRTIPRRSGGDSTKDALKISQLGSNMTSSTQLSFIETGDGGIDNKAFSSGPVFHNPQSPPFSSVSKPVSNWNKAATTK